MNKFSNFKIACTGVSVATAFRFWVYVSCLGFRFRFLVNFLVLGFEFWVYTLGSGLVF